MSTPRRVAVVGAGVTGLVVTWLLRRRRPDLAVTLYEAADRVGGPVHSERIDGQLVESGPFGILLNAPRTVELIEQLELGAVLTPADKAARHRWLYRGGRLEAMPSNPLKLAGTRLLSPRARLRLLKEPWIEANAPAASRDESVHAFLARRFGPEVADVFAYPLVSGITAGDAERTSVIGLFPRLVELERHRGSVIGGLMKKPGPDEPPARRKGKMKLHSFREGMGTLVEALGRAVAEQTVLNTPIHRVERDGHGHFVLRRGDEVVAEADDVVLCTPLDKALAMLGRPAPQRISYAGVTSTTLVFDRTQIPVPIDGFGALPCRGEEVRIRGCIFASSVFPSHAADGKVHLRVIGGGVTDPEFVEFGVADATAWVMADLRRMLGVTGGPLAVHHVKWPRAIPQLDVGAAEEIAQIAALEDELPGLHLGAGWRNGPGVNDCVELGFDLAARFSP